MQRKDIQTELSNLRAELRNLLKEKAEKKKMLQQLQKSSSSKISSQRQSSTSKSQSSTSKSQSSTSKSSQSSTSKSSQSSRPTVSSLGWTRTIKKPTIHNRLYISGWKKGASFDSVKREYYINKKIIYLNIPFDKKQGAKKLGAKFDWNKRSWYIEASLKRKNKQAYDELIENYLQDYESDFENDDEDSEIQQEYEQDLEYEQHHLPVLPSRNRIYLNVPFQSKGIAKRHGARWDRRYRVRKWYIDLTIPEKNPGDYSLLRRRFT